MKQHFPASSTEFIIILLLQPCNICSVGVLECLPIAVNYGLDDIHRKSLRWITKHYVRLWCSKAFATLPRELIDKCYNQHAVNMVSCRTVIFISSANWEIGHWIWIILRFLQTVNNVFETLTNCDKLFTLIPQTRWAEPCFVVTRKLHDFCIKFLANHFVEFLKSDAWVPWHLLLFGYLCHFARLGQKFIHLIISLH